jgi:DtxR family Mn-dependent transcriptional regulator
MIIFKSGTLNIFRSRKQKSLIEKEYLENALKHLYDCESKNGSASRESIAGALGIRRRVVSGIEENLENSKLITIENEKISLTQEGRSYALKIIRIHRLWESYLADKTGLAPGMWHQEAEEREHQISEEEADKLASKLGNPLYDPDGDPIPDKTGFVPPRLGILLRDALKDSFAKITHIEDEPEEVYNQIIAENVYPGMTIRILENDNGKTVFVADGEERVFTRLLTSNITIVEILASQAEPLELTTLDKLKNGFECDIYKVSKLLRGQQRRRLMDLGFVPGSRIAFEMSSAGGDPVAYRVRGAVAAIRIEQAKLIFVKNIRKVG